MYSEQIEKLIDIALADGELTEKEKQILFKRAESMGIDLDEFEMVLESKLFEKTRNKQEAPVVAPRSDKFGDIKKCPSCGAIVQSYSAKCTDCGYEYRDIQADVSINKLFEMLIEADSIEMSAFKESSINNTLASKKIGGGMLGGMLSSSLGHMAQMKEEEREEKHIKRHQEKILQRKTQIISNFPVPNSKESIIEFMTLGVTKAKPVKKGLFGSYTAAEKEHNELAPVWKQKCEQVLMKARIALKEDTKTIAMLESLIK